MKMKLIPLVIAISGLLIAIYLIWPEWFAFCTTHDRGDGVMVCKSPLESTVGDLLLPLAIAFISMTLIYFIATRKTFSRWLKFSIGYAIVIALLLFTVPELGYGAGGFGFTILETRDFALIYAILYALISLILLGISEFRERRKGR